MNDKRFAPQQYLGVMVSSTFTDLQQHREALEKAIEAQGLHAVAMEQDAALPDGTVIDSSLRKVRAASAYIGVISHKYGQVTESAESNPSGYSLTELEFREARRPGRPMLIFIMGEDHAVKRADVEQDPEKLRKLEAFREEVKRAAADSPVQRVYKEFNSPHEFEVAATQSVAELRRLLDRQRAAAPAEQPDGADGIPAPPALYAEPRYIGSHAFVGRAAELQTLSGWAGHEDPHPILLFDAIGGTGKSMLTWEWTLNHASRVRTDWAGTFWYSFYEKGAVMADFCRCALAYMTGRPLKTFRKKRQPELTSLLLRQLEARPWLLVLDGLERVLVAYHRYDAAQLADEAVGRTDQIAHRNPAAAIRPDDDELLRDLAAAAPSKVLITSRLVPRVLLNQAGRPIPGVGQVRLPGLAPADAEALLRDCGVSGDSRLIQAYLGRHCDCHPLVTSIVAGLVHDYLPARDDFDAWAADPAFGGRLNLAELDLVQKRNHILRQALAALPDESRQLLSTLALLSEAADYELLAALNPHLPARPQALSEPERPEDREDWVGTYSAQQYLDDHAWLESAEYQAATRQLASTVHDLERRGLLQYDRQLDRYDLHPVVRGYASGSLEGEDRDRIGQRVVDHFTQQALNPYDQAETLDDLQNGLQLVRTLLQLGRITSAAAECYEGLSRSLLDHLEAAAEALSLLRPIFMRDWTAPSADIPDDTFSTLATEAADAFQMLGQLEQALTVNEAALQVDMKMGNSHYTWIDLSHIAEICVIQNNLARQEKYILLELDLSGDMGGARFDRFRQLARIGRWADAEIEWRALDESGYDRSSFASYQGMAEESYAQFLFWQGRLTEGQLARAEELARSKRHRISVRSLHVLRGEWRLAREEWALAAESLHEAIRMTREAGLHDARLDVMFALAQFRLGQLPAPEQEAIRLSGSQGSAQLALAELWDAIGDSAKATEHALAAYRWAWADGEPYVNRYALDRASALLTRLRVEIPRLPAHDPAQDQPVAYEDQVRAFIEKQRAEPSAED